MRPEHPETEPSGSKEGFYKDSIRVLDGREPLRVPLEDPIKGLRGLGFRA